MLTPLLISLAVSVIATPILIHLARKMGWVVEPRDDRWHKKPTAIFGGVAIYLSFTAAFLLTSPYRQPLWALFICGTAIFAVGLWDDIRELKPQVKFLAQIVVSIVGVSMGISLDEEVIPWVWVSMPLAVFWLVGITNAVNILDNMDGLSSGVVFVASAVVAVGGQILTDADIAPLAIMLSGATLGFFIYNFNPAKIFMGDCGSMFLGFTLGSLTILSTNTAAEVSHIILSLIFPLGALIVPIFDTTLVSYQRASHGRSIAKGGRDHSSHRLVFLGLSERKAVLLLLLISLIGGLGSLLLISFATPLIAAVLVALPLIFLLFLGIYLGEVKVYEPDSRYRWKSQILENIILHKRQLLQIVVDLVLLTAAYTSAWLLRYDGVLAPGAYRLLSFSLPLLLAVKISTFWLFGLYRGQWRYMSIHDMVQLFWASLLGSLFFVALLAMITRFDLYPRSIIIIDFALCLLLVGGCRSLIRVFREKLRTIKGIATLIVGAGDGGELLLRELRNNPSYPFVPVGFIDDDPAKQGSIIHGIKVLGGREEMHGLCRKYKIRRVFISIMSGKREDFEDIYKLCSSLNIKCSLVQPMIRITERDSLLKGDF
jgi:UDP-GlcNAc:undecaprenyl-phosphate GlcNAc-1-phosphate transferase